MRRLLLSSLLWPTCLLAHSNEPQDSSALKPRPQLQIGALFSASTYSSQAKDVHGLWRIPGLLMGGEALPNAKGAQLDDAHLWARYQWQPNTTVHAAIGRHAGHTELSVENLYLDYQPPSLKKLNLAAGLVDAKFSPNASSHPSTRELAETSLLAQAFWGDSIHDLGLQLDWQVHPQLKLGMELYDGDFFPASKGEGVQVLFAQTAQSWRQWQFKAGVWGLQAKALERADERYQVGHSHGSAYTPPDIRFSGDSALAGVWLESSLALSEKLQAHVDYEAVQAKTIGSLSETNYRAHYQAEHLGYAFNPSLAYGAWKLSYRFEKLSLDNRLTGAGAEVLAQDANLLNSRQPQRQTLQLAWQAHKNLRLRAAYTQDETLPKVDERFSVGLVWQQVLHED
ncbi:MAG: hypothetical protein E6Q83_10365 [Thiothrix sp.]|nr:MAG: hypothetical protein E6Q83_10365 [Thiothrix sp.]